MRTTKKKEDALSFTIKKSDKVKIVVAVQEWQGEDVLDIRTFVIASKGDNAGKWIPTQKGVQIPINKAKPFTIRMVRLVKAALGE